MTKSPGTIGYACAYTPLALIDAAGFSPYRVLPLGDLPDKAGRFLHDNLCPHVKGILDRAAGDDLPPLDGVVVMNSCDALRRLADGWRRVRPDDPVALVDLPVTQPVTASDGGDDGDDGTVAFFGRELSNLAETLTRWGGRTVTAEGIAGSVERVNRIAGLLDRLRLREHRGLRDGGGARMQGIYNAAATEPLESTLATLEALAGEADGETDPAPTGDPVPIFLFGNVLPDPKVFDLFETCGARVAADDLCTGSRLFTPLEFDGAGTAMDRLARAILARPACARTFDPTRPGRLAETVLAAARDCGARGVIGHTVKFCDPYLARLPGVRETLQDAGIPFLLLEGDCTMRSIGQHRTRIEAFVEMLR